MEHFHTNKHYFKQYSLRMIIQSIFMGLMMAADKIIGALFIGVEALVATNLIGPLQLLVYGISTLFMSGLGPYVGFLLGKNNVKKANKTASFALVLLSIIMIAITLIIVCFPTQIATIMGARGELQIITTQYLYYLSWGFAAMVIAAAFDILIMNDGNPEFNFKINMTTTVLNLVLNIILVVFFKMGIIGLAIATTFSNIFHLAVSFYYMLFKSRKIKLRKPEIDFIILKRILYNGSSDFIGMFSEGFKRYVINIAIITFLTQKHLNAYSVVSLFTVIFIGRIFMGSMMGLQPIFSQMMGAEKYERLKPLLMYAVRYSTYIVIGLFLVSIPFMKFFMGFFLNDPESINIAFFFYLTYGAATLLENFPGSIILFFTSINRPLESIIFSIIRTLILLPVLSVLCIYVFADYGLMTGTLLAEIFMIIVSYKYLKTIDLSKLAVVE